MLAPTTHQPPAWLGWLLLISLLVMLNTHLFITAACGVDQYSLFAADISVSQPYPANWAQSPYPVLLTLLFNVVLAFLAYGVYRLIWWYFASPRSIPSENWVRNPFKQNAIALAIPVFIAMVPSAVLGYTDLKAYFIIVGALIVIVLCIVSLLKDPDVNVDPSTRGYWFNVAVVAIFVMMALSVVVNLYYQFAPLVPPTSNILWQLEWNLYPVDEFAGRARPAMLVFGMVSLAYMVAIPGGMLLATLHPPRIGQQSPDPAPEPEENPLQGPNITIIIVEEWARGVLRRLSDEVLGGERDPSYLVVLAGNENRISDVEYERLVDETRGLLGEVDLLVDRASGTVKNRIDGVLQRLPLQPTDTNYTFHTLCLYSRKPPGQPVTSREIATYLENETGRPPPANISAIVSSLRERRIPVISNPADRVTYLHEETKTCFIDRLPSDN